jgi:hypothetical protein
MICERLAFYIRLSLSAPCRARALALATIAFAVAVTVYPMPLVADTLEDALLPVRFTRSCYVEQAIYANQAIHLHVRNQHTRIGTIVRVEGHTLYYHTNRDSLRNIAGIGRDDQGGLVIATRYERSIADQWDGFLAISRAAGVPAVERSIPSRDHLRLNIREQTCTYLPSAPDMFVTAARLDSFVSTSRSVTFSNPLQLYHPRADKSGRSVLLASSPLFSLSTSPKGGQFWRIDIDAAKITPITLGRAGDAHSYRPHENINSILADPRQEGRFYVGIGQTQHPGRLLHVWIDGQANVLFERDDSEYLSIRGLPEDYHVPFRSANRGEAVLALASGPDGVVYFATPKGVYRLGDTMQAEWVGEPCFERVGGFFIARNLPGLAAILSISADDSRHLGAVTSKVFLVATPMRD